MLDASRPLRNHGQGAQLYLVDDLVTDSSFPLDPGGECLVQVIPHRAVILFPVDADPDWPLTFRDPNRPTDRSLNTTSADSNS